MGTRRGEWSGRRRGEGSRWNDAIWIPYCFTATRGRSIKKSIELKESKKNSQDKIRNKNWRQEREREKEMIFCFFWGGK